MSESRPTFGVAAAGDARNVSEFAQRAEALGFERVTMGEHVMDGEEHVSHHGDFFDLEDVTLVPRPAQQPHPPIWVAGRSEAAMRRAAVLWGMDGTRICSPWDASAAVPRRYDDTQRRRDAT